jgi:hypothetical protein
LIASFMHYDLGFIDLDQKSCNLKAAGGPCSARFVADSPLEEDGFEPPVPGGWPLVFLGIGKLLWHG